MNETHSILQDLEDAIARGTADSRERALWHATDLLIAGRYCEEEIATFGEVIGRLADEIETEARAKLAHRLARIEYSPASVVRKLAFDDAIEVAGPVLRESERLDDVALLENARTKSQAHLLAIAERKSLSPAVTDVLASRGNSAVANAVARNQGAQFSGSGFLHMVQRAENDSILAEHLGRRLDIPRHLFQQLIAKASDDVGKRLAEERPELVGEIHSSVANIAGDLQSKFGPGSRNYFVAKRTVSIQHRLGNLHESTIAGYAVAHKVEEVMIGLALLSGPAGRCRRAGAVRPQSRDAADVGQGAAFQLGHDHGAGVPRRPRASNHRRRAAGSGARLCPPRHAGLAQRHRFLSVTEESRQDRTRAACSRPLTSSSKDSVMNSMDLHGSARPLRREPGGRPQRGGGRLARARSRQ